MCFFNMSLAGAGIRQISCCFKWKKANGFHCIVLEFTVGGLFIKAVHRCKRCIVLQICDTGSQNPAEIIAKSNFGFTEIHMPPIKTSPQYVSDIF